MMTADAVRALGRAEDTFDVVAVTGDDRAGWTAQLRAKATPECAPRVVRTSGDPRVWVVDEVRVPPEMTSFAATVRAEFARLPAGVPVPAVDPIGGMARQVQFACAATLTCAVRDDESVVEIRVVIYEDGVARHALNAAVLEVAKARLLLTGMFVAMGQSHRRPDGAAPAGEPHPPAEARTDQVIEGKRCRHCDRRLEDDARFCAGCGARVD